MADFDLGGLLFGNSPSTGFESYLDPEQLKAMRDQGVMQAAMSLLRSSGPSRVPISIGQALGEAYGAGQTGYQQAQQQGLTAMMTRQKLDEAKRAQLMQENYAKMVMGLSGGQAPEMGAMTPESALAVPPTAGLPAGPTVARAAMIGQPMQDFAPTGGAGGAQMQRGTLTKEMAMLLSQLPASAGIPELMKLMQQPKTVGEPFRGADGKTYIRTETGVIPFATGLAPKPMGVPFKAVDVSGKPILLSQMDDATYRTVEGFGPTRDMVQVDVGGQIKFVDKDQISAGKTFTKGLSPQIVGNAETGFYVYGGGGGGGGAMPSAPSAAPAAAPVAGAPAGYVPRRTLAAEAPATAPGLGNIPGLTPLIPGTGSKIFGNEGDLRKEFTTQIKPFTELSQAYQKIETAAKNPSPAGDIALVYGFMKVLDPGSVVREGEFATAQNAGSVPDSVRNMYNRALSGERLGENTRLDFLSQARNIIESQRQVSGDVVQRYTDIAKRSKLSPEQVVFDPFSRIKTTQQRISETANTPLPKRRKDWYDQFDLVPAQ
jgi:hypothetical protein